MFIFKNILKIVEKNTSYPNSFWEKVINYSNPIYKKKKKTRKFQEKKEKIPPFIQEVLN